MQRFQKELQSAEACVRELLKRHPWMEAEKGQFGVAGTEYDFKKRKPAQLQKELAAKRANLETLSKKINKKVLSMLESAEQEYSDLRSKKEIVEKDKEKIEAVIVELAQKKIEALKTWSGSTTTSLDLDAAARRAREARAGRLPVEEGLIVKVGFSYRRQHLRVEGLAAGAWRPALADALAVLRRSASARAHLHSRRGRRGARLVAHAEHR